MKIRKWPYLIGTTVLFAATGLGCGTDITGNQGGEATNSDGDTLPINASNEDTASSTGGGTDAIALGDSIDDTLLADDSSGTTGTDGILSTDTTENDTAMTDDAGMEGDAIVSVDATMGDATMGDATMGDATDMAGDAAMMGDTDMAGDADMIGDTDMSGDAFEPDSIEVADTGKPDSEPVMGACCTANFDCVDMDDAKECTIAGGYFEEGLSCAEDWPCQVPGFVGIAVAGRERKALRTLRRV